MLTALNGWFRRLLTRDLLVYIMLAGFLFIVLFWRLSSLTPGLSPAEVAARSGSMSLRSIYESPVGAPAKLVQHFLLKIDPSSVFYLRLTSACLALIFTICFYKLAVSWFGRFIGLGATLVFISLPLFVISARQGSSEILFFWPILMLWLYYKLIKNDEPKPLTWLALLLITGLGLYVPGMVWWDIGAVIIARKPIVSAARQIPAWFSGAGLAGMLLAILPLIISAVSRPSIIKKLALVPDHWFSAVQTLEHVGWMVLALFIRTPSANPLILGRLPLINVLLLALLVFGVYAMYVAAKPKAYALGLSVLFAIVAAGLNNSVGLLALGLPALTLFISAGLRYLYIEWRSIFPRNPVPKTFALILIAAVVASQLFFGLRYSLVAWPHSASTKTVYMLK